MATWQQRAVVACAGPAVVQAGPGAGKTATLAARAARLIADGAAPEEIVAVTFSRRAAWEIGRRIEQATGARARAGTLHGLCAGVLRSCPQLAGRPSGWRVFRPEEALRAVERLCGERRDLRRALRRAGLDAAGGLAAAEAAQLRLLELEQTAGLGAAGAAAAAVWAALEQELRERRALTFALLLRGGVHALAREEGQAALGPLAHLLLDEAQDCCAAQIQLVWLIAARATVCAVGDPDQSIYGFRHATPGALDQLGGLLGAPARLGLSVSFRCRQEILEAAGRLIAANHGGRARRLVSASGQGGAVRALELGDERQERELVERLRARARSRGRSLLVLARTREHAERLGGQTIHAAKGLEADETVILGLEEGQLPHQQALAGGGQAAVQEERRLAFVALTRARERALLCACARRDGRPAQPSRFLAETGIA